MYELQSDDPLIKADLVDDLTKRVAELNERLARVEKFQADQRAAKEASESLRKQAQ
jgi:uncharacterized small protein (DUF1192 family)